MNEDRYAIYLRKSRADLEAEALGEGETLTRHRNILMKLAEKKEILPQQITIYQEVVSGESISARPEMQRLLHDVYQRTYKGVLVMEVERLARGNTKDQGEVSDAFQFSGTKIITPQKVYDPSNQFDQEYFEFGLFMSRREYQTIKRRMEAGRMESIAEGNYVGALRPYGYNIKRINVKERTLEINPVEAEYVKLMFKWFTEDCLSSGQIAKKLTDMQVPTLTGKLEWNRATVKDIIQNVHYTGMVRWNKRKSEKEYDADTGQIKKLNKRQSFDDCLIYNGKHQAIISKEQFDKAQTLFKGQIPVDSHNTVINPLAGIMKCAKCGKSIKYAFAYGKPNSSDRYLHYESSLCKMKSLSKDSVMFALIEALKAILEDFEIKMSNDTAYEQQAENKRILTALEHELSRLENKRNKLFDSYEDGAYTKEEFIERKQIINQSIESVRHQIKEQENSAPSNIDYEEKIISLHQLLDCLSDDSISAKDKNVFLKSIIDHIDLDVEDYGRKKGGKPILDIYLK